MTRHFRVNCLSGDVTVICRANQGQIIDKSQAGNIKTLASTITGNGDVNPYGVAVVPTTTGSLIQGNILISNVNHSANLEGTGTTIVQVSPSGTVSLFGPHAMLFRYVFDDVLTDQEGRR